MIKNNVQTLEALPVASTSTSTKIKTFAVRVGTAALVAAPALYSNSLAAGEGELTADNFTAIATKVLTYLGYAVAAGVTIVVAVVAAQAGWRFFGKFLKA